jgi:ornithine lipid hydroxylase
MNNLLSKWFLLLIILTSIVTFFIAKFFGTNLELVVLTLTISTLAISLYLEKTMPFSRQWNQQQGDTAINLTSAGFLLGVTDPLLKYLAPLAVVALYKAFNLDNAHNLFPTNAPFAVQVIIATLAIEFFRYWAHRWHHSNKYLWWLHAMHHSSERLHTINNFCFHPLNYVINFSFSVFPLMIIGVPSEVLFGYMVITQPVLMLQHANIHLRSGWLNYVFSTNELHRWHHSTQSTEANCNDGNAFIVWDIVFGTFKYQKQNNQPAKVGLFSQSSSYPGRSGYFAQLRSMFSPQCCKV